MHQPGVAVATPPASTIRALYSTVGDMWKYVQWQMDERSDVVRLVPSNRQIHIDRSSVRRCMKLRPPCNPS
jgi:hypothetical protein